MRFAALVFGLLLIAGSAGAQEWDEYTSLQDGFRINFPGTPKVTEGKWTSQLNYVLPDRVYSAERGKERYSVTVVDYSGIEQQGIERAKSCPPGNANCRANAPATLGPGYSHHDERGAIVYATFKLLQRDAKVNYLAWDWQDLVEGHIVQLTNNTDRSRTYVAIYMHDNRLYMLEGTVPSGFPEPALFQQSLGFVDKNGNGIRYSDYYDNDYPAPPPARRPGAAAPQPGAVATPPPVPGR